MKVEGIAKAGNRGSTGKTRKKSKNPYPRNQESYWIWKVENATTERQIQKVLEQWENFKAKSGFSEQTLKSVKKMMSEVKRTL